jgi:hypothetical protein
VKNPAFPVSLVPIKKLFPETPLGLIFALAKEDDLESPKLVVVVNLRFKVFYKPPVRFKEVFPGFI